MIFVDKVMRGGSGVAGDVGDDGLVGWLLFGDGFGECGGGGLDGG